MSFESDIEYRDVTYESTFDITTAACARATAYRVEELERDHQR